MITSKLAKQLCIDMTYSSHTSNNNSHDDLLTDWFGDIFEYGGIIAVVCVHIQTKITIIIPVMVENNPTNICYELALSVQDFLSNIGYSRLSAITFITMSSPKNYFFLKNTNNPLSSHITTIKRILRDIISEHLIFGTNECLKTMKIWNNRPIKQHQFQTPIELIHGLFFSKKMLVN